MQVWNVLHAARWKYRTQKIAKIRHLCTIARLCRAVSSQGIYRQSENLLNTNISSRCLHNMANFGPLTAEIGLPVLGTAANFNRVTARHSSSAWASAKLCGVEQRVPPTCIFGKAAITLGIDPHFWFFFPRLISAVTDWMSTILLHMVWFSYEFRMQVWNVLMQAARWKYRTQKLTLGDFRLFTTRSCYFARERAWWECTARAKCDLRLPCYWCERFSALPLRAFPAIVHSTVQR